MSTSNLLEQISDYANRSDPFSLYARFEQPVTIQDDGAYAVSGYNEIVELLHDPRISSDRANRTVAADDLPIVRPFLVRDGLDHDRLRRIAMRQFGPPGNPTLIPQQEPEIRRLADELIDDFSPGVIDIVNDFAYPIPVQVICQILGVPPEDERQFREWAATMVEGLDTTGHPEPGEFADKVAAAQQAMVGYVGELIEKKRENPGDGLVSRLANETGDDTMSDLDVQISATLLLIAGHETTVNLIGNGMLTLLRHPEYIERLREDAGFAVPLVEELLRFEPPVHLLPNRTPLEDIEVAGVTIPKGSTVVLLLAAGDRDPNQFANPHSFDPDRPDLQHLGFGGGIHYCFGAPLARVEAQVALTQLARRLVNPRLVVDPPPYRPSPVLRGPVHLEVEIDGVDPA